LLFQTRPSFLWPAFFLLVEGCLYLLYVKVGKFRHRDYMLGMHTWKGDEQVLDVGCGRGAAAGGSGEASWDVCDISAADCGPGVEAIVTVGDRQASKG
jgi:hypothetical protein